MNTRNIWNWEFFLLNYISPWSNGNTPDNQTYISWVSSAGTGQENLLKIPKYKPQHIYYNNNINNRDRGDGSLLFSEIKKILMNVIFRLSNSLRRQCIQNCISLTIWRGEENLILLQIEHVLNRNGLISFWLDCVGGVTHQNIRRHSTACH